MGKANGSGDTAAAVGIGTIVAGVATVNPVLIGIGIVSIALGSKRNRPDLLEKQQNADEETA